MAVLDTAKVKAHLARLEELAPDEPSWWRVGARWAEHELVAFEAKHFALPADYRAWLREIGDGGAGLFDLGLEPLAGRDPKALAVAAKPFRLKDECRAFKWPVAGMLFLSRVNGGNTASLVVRGKRAGDVWIDGTMYDGAFFREATFAEIADRWIDLSLAKAEDHARPRDESELTHLDLAERWKRLGSDLIPWLRTGADVFVRTFHEEPPEQRERVAEWLHSAMARRTERWLRDPTLAAVAASVLRTVHDDFAPARDPAARLLDAMFTEQDPPDTSPAKVLELTNLLKDAPAPQRDAANGFAKWLQLELVKDKRLDEAIALLRVQPYVTEAYWIALARALIAKDRSAEAFALYDEVAVRGQFLWGAARGWLQLEADERAGVRRPKKNDPYAKMQAQQAGWGFAAPKTLRLADCGAPGVRIPTAQYQLIALLFGVAGDGKQMAEVASQVLAIPGLRRKKRELIAHTAHERMGLALAGRSSRKPREWRNGPRLRLAHYPGYEALAAAILAKTGDIGIDLIRAK